MTDEARHRITIEVRFRDVDAFGHVNNAVFFSYVEQARIRYLVEALEVTEFAGLPLILARVEMDYRAPILFGEPLEVTSRVDWIGRTSFAMSHRILAGTDGHLAAEAHTVLVSYDYAHSRPMPVPDDWHRRLEAVEGRSLAREKTDAASPQPAGAPS